MLSGIMFLASCGISSGGTIGNFLYNLETLGFFSYVLPFLMIFAIVFAILEKIGFLGKNKGINFVLALAVALMALQFQFVSYFFAEIFPRLGVLLSILLVAIILLSLFLDFKKKGTKFAMGLIAFVGFIVIVLQSFSDAFPWSGNIFNGPFWWSIQPYLPEILTGIMLIVFFIIITKGPAKEKFKDKYLKIADKHSSDDED